VGHLLDGDSGLSHLQSDSPPLTIDYRREGKKKKSLISFFMNGCDSTNLFLEFDNFKPTSLKLSQNLQSLSIKLGKFVKHCLNHHKKGRF
jgi:hypothetical protein